MSVHERHLSEETSDLRRDLEKLLTIEKSHEAGDEESSKPKTEVGTNVAEYLVRMLSSLPEHVVLPKTGMTSYLGWRAARALHSQVKYMLTRQPVLTQDDKTELDRLFKDFMVYLTPDHPFLKDGKTSATSRELQSQINAKLMRITVQASRSTTYTMPTTTTSDFESGDDWKDGMDAIEEFFGPKTDEVTELDRKTTTGDEDG